MTQFSKHQIKSPSSFLSLPLTIAAGHSWLEELRKGLPALGAVEPLSLGPGLREKKAKHGPKSMDPPLSGLWKTGGGQALNLGSNASKQP